MKKKEKKVCNCKEKCNADAMRVKLVHVKMKSVIAMKNVNVMKNAVIALMNVIAMKIVVNMIVIANVMPKI